MVSLIIPKVIILIIITLHAIFDANMIKHNQSINHIKHSLIMILIGIVLLFPFVGKNNIVEIILFGLIANAGLFDFILNIARGKSLFYISPEVNKPYSGPNVSLYDNLLKNKVNIIRVLSFIITIILLK